MSNDTIRICGCKLGVDRCFVDVSVENIDIDGKVKLTNANDSTQTWNVELSKLQQWRTDNQATEHGNLSDVTANVWNAMDEIFKASTDTQNAPIEYELQEKAEEVFELVVKAQS